MLESNDSAHDKASSLSTLPTKFRAVLRIALIFVAYLLAFTMLDLRSHALQVFPGIVAWYPPDGLSFAFLLVFGASFLPAFVIASLISSFFVFQFRQPFSALVGWAIFISLTYSLAAWFLRRRVRIDSQLRSPRDLFWLIASAAIVSTILAIISVTASTANGAVPHAARLWATVQWWTGEMIGILIIAPALLIHVMPHVKRFAEGEALIQKTRISLALPSPWIIMQVLSIIIAIYLAVDVSWPNDFHPFFLIAIPLIWIAIQHGLSGASIANILVNFGITSAVQRHHNFNVAELGQLQLLMLVMIMASLLIGIMVSENKRLMYTPITEMERQRKRVVYELIIISISGMAAWVFEYTFDFFEAITEWETRNQIKGVVETLVAISVLGLASAIFSYRRWKEVQVEIREREKAQAELQALYRELEARVQERTADLSKANVLLEAEISERRQAETALKNAEAKYRTLVEQLPAVTYIVEYGENTNPIYISPQIESVVGFSAEEWLADPDLWVNQLHPEDRDRVLAEFALQDQLSQPIDIDYRILTRDGRVRWIHDQSVLILDETGPRYGHGLIFDITERKQTEESLEQSEKRFRALIENSADAITLLDSNGVSVYDSPAASGMLGYGPDELIGQNIFKLLHTEDLTTIQPLFQRLAETPGARSNNIFRIRHKNGSWRWIEAVVTNLLAEPSVRAIVANYRDITERKQAEEILRDSEDRYRDLVDNSQDLICTHDMEGRILSVNPFAEQTLGYPTGEVLKMNLRDIMAPQSQKYFRRYLSNIRRQGIATGIMVVQTINGKERIWEYRNTLRTEGVEEPVVRGMARDITERKQAEEELSTLYELSRALAEANELDQVLDLVNRRTVESVRTTFSRIALLEGDEFVTRSAYPIRVLDHELFVGSRNLISAMPYCQRVVQQNEPVILHSSNAEVSNEESAALLLDFAQTLCLIPLRVHDFALHSSRILGLLMVGESRKDEREPFTAEKMRLTRSIGDQAAIAINNTRLFYDLESSNINLSRAYDATIAGWSAAMDLRDKETEGHTLRVTEMTLRLAKRMEVSEQELIQVRRGALLHDIGKMGIPDRILLKPDKLTDEEWEAMRLHPTYAYQLLKPITYLSPALDIPYCHHEKWDGTGYPRGLKGLDIPLTARIFTVVDVYDALTSDRPYREGWSREKTLEHIRELSGSHFDPQVVGAFLKMVDEDS